MVTSCVFHNQNWNFLQLIPGFLARGLFSTLISTFWILKKLSKWISPVLLFSSHPPIPKQKHGGQPGFNINPLRLPHGGESKGHKSGVMEISHKVAPALEEFNLHITSWLSETEYWHFTLCPLPGQVVSHQLTGQHLGSCRHPDPAIPQPHD